VHAAVEILMLSLVVMLIMYQCVCARCLTIVKSVGGVCELYRWLKR
jgi:hypothetical protein